MCLAKCRLRCGAINIGTPCILPHKQHSMLYSMVVHEVEVTSCYRSVLAPTIICDGAFDPTDALLVVSAP